MTDPARAQTVDTEIAKHCAYSLPGVALTLGRQNWHCLKDTYETLASDVQVKYVVIKIYFIVCIWHVNCQIPDAHVVSTYIPLYLSV